MEPENMINHLPNNLAKFHFCKKKKDTFHQCLHIAKCVRVSEKAVFATFNYYFVIFFTVARFLILRGEQ